MSDRADGGLGGRVEHPIEEWTDRELVDQLVYVRAEFADMDIALDDPNSPMAEIEREIARRGLEIPGGSDLSTPGREESNPDDEAMR
jgi:hypothetical protein